MNEIKSLSTTKTNIQNKIYTIRGVQVMLDEDLAVLYKVSTKRLNEQVKRNKTRFPNQFCFKLNRLEYDNLKSQFATSSLGSRSQIVTLNEGNSQDKRNSRSQFATLKVRRGKNIKYLPYAFTEQGVAMLSSVLRSKRAVEVNISIMRIFVNIRKFISSYEGLAMKIAELEKKYDVKITKIMSIIDQLINKEDGKDKNEIGFKVG